MKKHSLPFLLVAVLMLAGALLAGCQGNTNTPAPATSAPAAAETSAAAETPAATESAATEPSAAPALEPYTFTHYFNYDWWTIHEWGKDEVSKYYQKKYNITVDFSKPDSDPAAKLNIMISADELPDSIMMDRGVDNQNLAKLGKLLPLEPFMEKNKNLEDNLLPTTIDQLKLVGEDGQRHLYSIPNWPRKGPTGGNDAWLYDTRIWEAAGKPELKTLDDLYNYAKKAKELGKNKEGLDIIPMMIGRSPDGYNLGRGFYRSFGGVLSGWYSPQGDRYQLALRDPVFKQATMEVNKWWREGLISASQFTDSEDQIKEKLVSGRIALMFYDHSQDSVNHFRQIVRESFPGGSIELTDPLYPPAAGVSKVYADHKETIGWNVTNITTKAKQPERIFTLWTDFLTKEGSVIMMYGPKGFNWDELNADGLPLLKKAESEQTPEEKDALGAWFWAMPGQSDNVDTIKFAVNDMLPAEKQDWVIWQQAHKFTPIMWVSDEFVGIADVIDPLGDEGINRKLVEDNLIAEYPKVIMAATAEEAATIYDKIVKFADDNGLKAVEDKYTEKYKANVAAYGTGIAK